MVHLRHPLVPATVICPLLCSLIVVACGGSSGRGGLRAAYEKNIEIMEDFTAAMDKASNADQVAKALNEYADEIEGLLPRLQALKKSHPELEEAGRKGALPDELKDLEDSFASLGMKMMRAMAKAMEYEEDPKVREAQKRMMASAEKLM